ncbi:hypothetical protein LOZ66_002018 [Ophidiomyces ophidiicola]|nr:hypothetical protein LOZ66_002018 [Ophidiomyces ophidiicola]
MTPSILQFLSVATTCFLAAAASFSGRRYDDEVDEVIARDVCIIGGGASGTYAAVQLKDMGKSSILIEKKDILGGHTDRYIDPITKKAINFGVMVFSNLNVTTDFFGRLKIPHKKTFLGDPTSKLYADFRTGNVYRDHRGPNITKAITTYALQTAKYPELGEGYFLPDPVPEDLVLPFGEFVKKYDMGDALEIVNIYLQGFGNILERPTLSIMKTLDLVVLNDIQNGYLIPSSGDNHEVYDKAFEIIKSDVLLQSQVQYVDRRSDHVTVFVKTLSGRKIIRAKKLLVTIPPSVSNLAELNLDREEESIFGQFNYTAYYTSLIKIPGFPKFDSMINYNPNYPYGLPELPDIYWITPTIIPDVYDVKAGSPHTLREEDVKTEMINKLKLFQAKGSKSPEFVAWSNHSPFGATVPRGAIKTGFYKKLYALQGRHSTYYTGAAFHAHNSALLWRFTKELVSKMMK